VTDPDDPNLAAYTAPGPGEVHALMDELVGWLNNGDAESPALVRAAMAHLNLVKVHPWSDGNGRMSRSLQTLVIAREGVLAPEFSSIEEWLGRRNNTLRYYNVLADVGGPVWSPRNDTRPWIRFCLKAHHQSAQSVQQKLERSSQSWSLTNNLIEEQRLDERMVSALHEAFLTGRVRRHRYQVDEQLSDHQALRDLSTLVKLGLLKAEGQGRLRYYVPGDKAPAGIMELVARPQPLLDPYV
jgi:Fic family protein